MLDARTPGTTPTHPQNKSHQLYLGLETPSNGRPHVVNRNSDVSLHAHSQRENHLTLLDPVFSGEHSVDWADEMWPHLLQCPHFNQPTSSSRTPVRWWRSLSRRWGCRRTDDSRCAAYWSRGWDSWWGLWSPRAWNGVNWASLTPCYTHSLCTCTGRRKALLLCHFTPDLLLYYSSIKNASFLSWLSNNSVLNFLQDWVWLNLYLEQKDYEITEAYYRRSKHFTPVDGVCVSR